MNAKQMRAIVLAVVAVLIISILLVLYFNIARPLKKEVEALSEKIEADTKILETIREKIAEQPKLEKEEALKLQAEVPLEPFVDQLILDLRSIEQASQNTIDNIAVAYSQIALSELAGANHMAGIAEAAATTSSDSAQEDDAGTLQVHKINLVMKVESPTYEHLRQFVLGIERLERVIKIESLTFASGQSSYQITLSAFYAPQFEDIEDRLPKANFPQPVKKNNPTASWGGML